MKIINYFLPVTAGLLIATTGIAFAQQGAPGGNPAQAQMAAQMAAQEKELGITPQQKAKLTAISGKYRPKLVSLNNKYDPQFRALQVKMQELQKKAYAEAKPTLEAQQKEMDTVLTPAQKAKIKQMKAASMQRR